MSDLPEPRIADVDRDRASERLRVAYADGRITEAELEERLRAVFEAKTASQLDVVFADLRPAAVVFDSPAVRPSSSAPLVPHRWRPAVPLLLPAVVCTLIYFMTTPGGYFWPMWVWLGCSIPTFLAVFFGGGGDAPEVPPPTRSPELPS